MRSNAGSSVPVGEGAGRFIHSSIHRVSVDGPRDPCVSMRRVRRARRDPDLRRCLYHHADASVSRARKSLGPQAVDGVAAGGRCAARAGEFPVHSVVHSAGARHSASSSGGPQVGPQARLRPPPRRPRLGLSTEAGQPWGGQGASRRGGGNGVVSARWRCQCLLARWGEFGRAALPECCE